MEHHNSRVAHVTGVRSHPVTLRECVTLRIGSDGPDEVEFCNGGPDALLGLVRARWEGRVHPIGWIAPGSLALTGSSAGVCGDDGSVEWTVEAAGVTLAPEVGDVVRLHVLMRGARWGTLGVTVEGSLWVFLQGDVGEGVDVVDAVLKRIIRRVGEGRMFAAGERRS